MQSSGSQEAFSFATPISKKHRRDCIVNHTETGANAGESMAQPIRRKMRNGVKRICTFRQDSIKDSPLEALCHGSEGSRMSASFEISRIVYCYHQLRFGGRN